MEMNEIISFTNEVNKAKSVEQLILLESKYTLFIHPYRFYIFGVNYKIKKDDTNSFKCFKYAAEFGLKDPNRYLSTIFSDSVGSGLCHMLTKFSSVKLSSDLRYKLFVNSYIFLSSAIEHLGITAYESHKHRAQLLLKFEAEETISFMYNYLGADRLPKVLILSDYYFASQGYLKHGFIELSQTFLNKAITMHNWLEDIVVSGKNADLYSIEEISNIGIKRHNRIFSNLNQDYIDKKFSFDLNLLKFINL